MKQTNQTKQSNKFDKTINVILLIMLGLMLLYVISTVVNGYIDYRIDKYFNDNQVWYLLEECI